MNGILGALDSWLSRRQLRLVNDIERYESEFAQSGEAEVRKLLEQGRLSEFKANVARHWLAEHDRARAKSSQAESAALAREAAVAARDQADAAREANRIAKQANIISIGAAIIAIAAIAISLFK